MRSELLKPSGFISLLSLLGSVQSLLVLGWIQNGAVPGLPTHWSTTAHTHFYTQTHILSPSITLTHTHTHPPTHSITGYTTSLTLSSVSLRVSVTVHSHTKHSPRTPAHTTPHTKRVHAIWHYTHTHSPHARSQSFYSVFGSTWYFVPNRAPRLTIQCVYYTVCTALVRFQ